jgi:hypothetical protein
MLSEAVMRPGMFAFPLSLVLRSFDADDIGMAVQIATQISGASNLNRAFHPHLAVQECRIANRNPPPIC